MVPGDVLRLTAVQRAVNVVDIHSLLGASSKKTAIGCVRAHRQGQQNEKTHFFYALSIFLRIKIIPTGI